MVTWGALVLGAVSAVMLGMGRFGSAAMLMTLTAFCDLLDGLLARTTNTSTPSGAVLDSSIDRYVDFFLLFGIAILYRHSLPLLLITLLALQGSFMVSYSSSKAEALDLRPPRGSMKRIERFGILTFGAIFATFSVIGWETPAEYAGGIHVGYPLLLAVGIIAIWANISDLQRLRFIVRQLSENDSIQSLHPGGR